VIIPWRPTASATVRTTVGRLASWAAISWVVAAPETVRSGIPMTGATALGAMIAGLVRAP